MQHTYCRKLIEVDLSLDEIDVESVRSRNEFPPLVSTLPRLQRRRAGA